MKTNTGRRRAMRAALMAAALLQAACSIAGDGTPPPRPGMTASVTYIDLLAKTPFFTRLDRQQLQHVIDHSREWSVPAHNDVADSGDSADRIWVLLDGGWQVDSGGRSSKAGKADPGKWYGGAEMAKLGGRSRLVTTAHSYCMVIRQADFDAMLAQGFPFEPHLQQGLAHYRAVLAK